MRVNLIVAACIAKISIEEVSVGGVAAAHSLYGDDRGPHLSCLSWLFSYPTLSMESACER